MSGTGKKRRQFQELPLPNGTVVQVCEVLVDSLGAFTTEVITQRRVEALTREDRTLSCAKNAICAPTAAADVNS